MFAICGSQFDFEPTVSHGFWDIKTKIYRGHDLDLFWGHVTWLVTRPLDAQCMVSCRWSFESIDHSISVTWLLRYYVSNTQPNILPLEIRWSPFSSFWGKIAGYSILQFCVHSRSPGTSFELLTATIGPRASLLRCPDLPIENALRGWKIGQNRGTSRRILTRNESFLTFGPLVSISSKSNKNCDRIYYYYYYYVESYMKYI